MSDEKDRRIANFGRERPTNCKFRTRRTDELRISDEKDRRIANFAGALLTLEEY